MNQARAAVAMLLGTVLIAGTAATAQEKPANDPSAPLPDRIEQAVHFGTVWLKKQVYRPGNWQDEIHGSTPAPADPRTVPFVHPTGCTSLALLALLKSGVPPQDPVIQDGFKWLRTGRSRMTGESSGPTASNYRPAGTYEIAALVLALEAKSNPRRPESTRGAEPGFLPAPGEKLLPSGRLPPEDLAWMRELVEGLMRRFTPRKAWRYGISEDGIAFTGERGESDMSATALAMAAILAGERCSIGQPDHLYTDVLDWVLGLQEKDGPVVERKGTNPAVTDRARGWGYLGSTGGAADRTPTGSMTASALGTIFLCSSMLETRKSVTLTADRRRRTERAWWDGLGWLDRSWDLSRNPGSDNYHHYHLLGLERLADSAGMEILAGHGWFKEGATVLVDSQAPSGAWQKRDTHEPSDILNTCFALLFLGRATPTLLWK